MEVSFHCGHRSSLLLVKMGLIFLLDRKDCESSLASYRNICLLSLYMLFSTSVGWFHYFKEAGMSH